MGKLIKFTKSDINHMMKMVLSESRKQKQSKKEKSSKYDTWCKDNGWEHGIGSGCADDALDSDKSDIRAWALGFLMGIKETTLKEEIDPYANKRYDAASDEWVGKEVSGPNEVIELVLDMKYLMKDIINRIDTLEAYKQKEIEGDVQSLDHKISVLWEKVKYLQGDDEGDETWSQEDERRYSDQQYPQDDESRYDDRNYIYGNHPDD